MTDLHDFRIVLRGYEPAQVAETIAQLAGAHRRPHRSGR